MKEMLNCAGMRRYLFSFYELSDKKLRFFFFSLKLIFRFFSFFIFCLIFCVSAAISRNSKKAYELYVKEKKKETYNGIDTELVDINEVEEEKEDSENE